jgi:HEAT repeat protein
VKKRVLIGLGMLVLLLLLGGVLLITTKTTLSAERRQVLLSNTMLLLAPDAHKRDEVAAPALRQMGSAACPQLIEWLEDRPRWSQRARAAIAAKSPPWLAKKLTPAFNTNVVIQANLRLASARALGVLGPAASAAVPALVRTLRDPGHQSVWQTSSRYTPDLELRWEATRSLGLIGSNAVPELIIVLRDKDPNVRLAAAHALAGVQNSSTPAIPALISALSDQDAQVRDAAGSALTTIGQPVVPFLVEVITREHGELQRSAAKALIQVNSLPRLIVPLFLKMLDDPEPETRRQAIELLAWSGVAHAGVPEAFTRCLSDSNETVRVAASNGLVKIGRDGAAAASK